MIEIFLASIFSSIIIFGYGLVFSNFSFGKQPLLKKNYSEVNIFGIVFVSFLSVIINFIFPIDKIVGSFFLIFGAIFFITFLIKNPHKKKIFNYIFLSSVITFF